MSLSMRYMLLQAMQVLLPSHRHRAVMSCPIVGSKAQLSAYVGIRLIQMHDA